MVVRRHFTALAVVLSLAAPLAGRAVCELLVCDAGSSPAVAGRCHAEPTPARTIASTDGCDHEDADLTALVRVNATKTSDDHGAPHRFHSRPSHGGLAGSQPVGRARPPGAPPSSARSVLRI